MFFLAKLGNSIIQNLEILAGPTWIQLTNAYGVEDQIKKTYIPWN